MRRTLSEAESKRILASYGLPVLDERTAKTADDAVLAAGEVGYPVAVKLCAAGLAHKSERGLVRLGLADAGSVQRAATELLDAARPDDDDVELLVAPMVYGNRELIAGLHTDPQFGPCVMIGVGGTAAEALGDVAFRLAPLSRPDAEEMLEDLHAQALLDDFRGEPPVRRDLVAETLMSLSRLAEAEPTVVAVDVNPLIVVDGRPRAVDALVELDE